MLNSMVRKPVFIVIFDLNPGLPQLNFIFLITFYPIKYPDIGVS
jgi:hypothetical protein